MVCPRCKTNKDKLEFGNRKRSEKNKTGREWWCKECNVKYAKQKREEYKKKNKDLTYDSTDLISKVCTKCKIEKPIELFKIVKHEQSGFHSRCRDCVNAAIRHRKGVLNPDIKRRPKIKCYSCHQMKAKRRFSLLKDTDRGKQYWCFDCSNIVREKRRTRKEYKINTDKLLVSTTRQCKNKECTNIVLNKSRNRYCSSCKEKYSNESKKRHTLKIDKPAIKAVYDMLILADGKKICKGQNGCNTEKPYKDFYVNYESQDHLSYYCKDCTRKERSKHYQDNKDSYRKRHRAWKRENRVDIKRRHKEAKVAWGDTTTIRLIYKEMRRLNKEAGYVAFHVDHIVPMHHPLVCGLHVEHNLQIITASENEHKGNTFIPG